MFQICVEKIMGYAQLYMSQILVQLRALTKQKKKNLSTPGRNVKCLNLIFFMLFIWYATKDPGRHIQLLSHIFDLSCC